MHDKFMIVDKKIVATGSYNWTTNATDYNDENLIIITSDSTAAAYNNEFNRIWDSAGSE
jgi:phosphatidylserine/phosphatidylglycerophosphate/cardiolipin synthase-like enzyme